MTFTLKIKNEPGPYTIKVERHVGEGVEALGVLAPGEEATVCGWKEAKLVISEVEG